MIDLPPVNVVSRVRAWDLASSVPSESNPDPDYTASVKISRDRFGVYYIEDVNRFRKRTSEVIESIVSEHHADGLDTTRCVVPRDPGAGGAHFNSYLVKVLAENGIYAKSCQVSGHSGKLQRFLPLCSLAQSGYLKVLKAEWNEEFFEELENFTGGRKGHDDMVDAASDAFNTLARELHMPVIDLPDFSKQDSIPRF